MSILQLKAEPWWGREVVTPELRWLGDELCARTKRPRAAAGDKGDVGHLSGAHRSQEWLQRSAWCLDRAYTVQPRIGAEQLRHVAAFDFTPGAWGSAANRALVTEQTRRLVAAGLAGRLPGVHEVIGTLNGRTVAGVNVPEGQTWSADASHLDHWHLTFDRRRMADRSVMERVVAVALGEDGTVATSKEEWIKLLGYDDAIDAPDNWPSTNRAMAVRTALTHLLSRSEGDHDDLAALKAALSEVLALIRAADGDAATAALAHKLDQVVAGLAAVQTSTANLDALIRGLLAREARRDAALANAYGAN